MAKTFRATLIFLLFFGVFDQVAEAATLSFAPASGSYTVGNTFAVAVRVSSTDQAMNAASGAIAFSNNKLEVVSLSKSGSIFNLWVQEPSFSNSTGMVSFEGIVLDPGFTGANGKIITVNFRVKSAGTAPISFSSGSVLANDGAGTSILKSLGGASFNLGTAPPSEIAPPAPAATPPETLPVAIPETPTITNYPSQLQTGDTLVVEGTTDPDSRVALWLQQLGVEARKTVAIITSDQHGNFIFIYQKQLKEGIYEFWAEALSDENIISVPSEKFIAQVEGSASTPSDTPACTADYFTVIIALLTLIVLLLVIIWYGWHKLFLLEARLHKRAEEELNKR